MRHPTTDEARTAPASLRRERRDAAANRQQILATARRLFAAQGIEATTMQEIARQAGVGQGTLYRRYAHKGELCTALLLADLDAFKIRLVALISDHAATASALTRLEQLLDELLVMTERHIPLLVGMHGSAVGPQGDARFQNPFRRWLHDRIRDLLDEAVALGEIADLDTEFAADAIFAAVEPALFVFQQQQRGFSRERIAAGVRRLFITALRSERRIGDSDPPPA